MSEDASFQFVGWSIWYVAPLAALVVWLVLRVQSGEIATLTALHRRWLAVLRGLCLCMLFSMFLEPTWSRHQIETEVPAVAVLVDQSESMQVTMDETLRQADGSSEFQHSTRADRANRWVRESLSPRLKDRCRVKVFRFDDRLEVAAASGRSATRHGRATDFHTPLAELARNWAHEHLGAVVLLTDARQTAGLDPLPVVRAMRGRGSLLTVVTVGEEHAPADAVVAEVAGRNDVAKGENISADVRFRIHGLQDRNWVLSVGLDGKVVEARPVNATGDWQHERFELPADSVGIHTVSATLEAPADGSATRIDSNETTQEAALENNRAERLVSVHDDPLHILVVDAWPRWETRYLVTLLERDRQVDLARRYRSVQVARNNYELLPSAQKDLDNYDVVVVGDLAADELSIDDQRRLTEFVGARGGFLILSAGPRGMPAAFNFGPLADLLPVSASGPAQPTTETVSLLLTPTGMESPITTVLLDRDLNRRLWPALPPLQWWAAGVQGKAGATVLVVSDDPSRTPIVAVQRFGAGRVLWMGSPESWRWRDRLEDRVHRVFWMQAITWGLGARLRGKDPRLQISLERNLLDEGESTELRGRVRLRDGSPIDQPMHAQLVRLNDDGRAVADSVYELEMSPAADGSHICVAALDDLAEGRWRVSVTSPHPDLSDCIEVRELVVRSRLSDELLDLSADVVAAERLSAAGGCHSARLSDAPNDADSMIDELLQRLKPRRREHVITGSLWDNYAALLLVLVLLVAEWVTRKRHGLA